MKGAISVLFYFAFATQGSIGFVVPASPVRSTSGLATKPTAIAALRQSPAAGRLCMSTTSTPKFSVSLMDDTRVSFAFEKENLSKLATQVNAILASFKRLKANAAEGGKPYREEAIEYKDTVDGLNILVECNPNIFPDPFKAQVFIRIWDDKVEISSQAMLTKLTDAIKQHMAALKA